MFIVIDKPDASFRGLCSDLNKSGVSTTLLSEPGEIDKFISHYLEGENVFMIHGSVGITSIKSDKGVVSDTVAKIIETVHDQNPLARIIIFSNAAEFPLRRYITELQIDGHANGVFSLDQLERIGMRGNVSADELRLRGQSAEDMRTGLRVSGETSGKYYREREILD